MKSKKPIIFSDFDGTFMEKDVGYRMFTHFSGGRNSKLVEEWKRGHLSSRECLMKEAAMLNASLNDIHTFLDEFKLSAGALEFYEIIERQKIPFFIVSDGVDIYIDYILKKYGLGGIRYFCNHGKIQKSGLQLEFSYDNYDCTRCGCCKGARIIDLVGGKRGEWEVVFIGDGLSDICAVPQADIIFARGDLLKYCRSKNRVAIEFVNFFDILNFLRKSGVIAE